ncbi:MAG: hypothetical protein WBM42_04385 [Eudoraea sp.]|uniref:hypothetical protein n=1 Tax=Eudoraea sp. TaxID=1979955 RepID=UPI003C77C6AB
MKSYTICGLIVLIVFLTSCAETLKKEVEAVNYIDSPAGDVSSLPYLFSNGENTLMSWVEHHEDTLASLYYAELKDVEWQTSHKILQGDDWFVNWADFPMIAENRGNLLSHVLKKSSEGTYSYDVKLNVLPKGSENWMTDLPLHTDDTPTEHGFVSAVPYKGGSFFITWLDGRNTEEKEDGSRGAMTVRAAEVSAKGEVSKDTVLDVRTCDCCQTTTTITANGPVVIYRDRSEEEIRDMSIVRLVEGKWTAPKTIYSDNWLIKGCPVNGPKASSIGNNLAVAWFTAAGDLPKVNLVFSNDGGEHFDSPIRVDEADALGRVDVLLLDADTAIVSWMEAKDSGAQLKAVKIIRSGKKSDYKIIAELDGSRKTGFPQMELVGNSVYFAWTDVAKGVSNIKIAYVPVGQF